MQVIKIHSVVDIPFNYTGIIEFTDGSKWWILNEKCHREDGPAIIEADGSKRWYLNGMRHREDGPAVEYVDGQKVWYLNDEFLFGLPRDAQPFILLEEFVDEKGKKQIKILNQKGVEVWPNLPGLKELADNWEKK
jgi:hypothetical protein